jgi:flagellar biosynthesis protein FlhG
MTDQAQRLREIVAALDRDDGPVVAAGFFARESARLPRIVTCTSCGEQTDFAPLVTNLAVGLAKFAPPVLILDASFETTALCRLVGRRPRRTLNDLTRKKSDLADTIAAGPAGVNLMLVDHTFIERLATLDVGQLEPLLVPLSTLKSSVHLVLLSLANGFTLAALNFLVASQEVALVTATDEESVRQCYLLIKIIHKKNPQCRIGLVTAGPPAARPAATVNRSIIAAARKFLNCPVVDLGTMTLEGPAGEGFFVVEHPASALGKSVDIIAEKLYYNSRDN